MRFAVLLLGLSCCARGPVPLLPAPYRIPGFSITPPPTYALWFAQAHNCAFRLRSIMGDSARFTVDAQAVDLSQITWIAVPTERPDGRFAAGVFLNRDSLFVYGMTSGQGDTIWLPAPRLDATWIVKHEAMHVFVQSPSELNYGPHGLPWGFCEFL